MLSMGLTLISFSTASTVHFSAAYYIKVHHIKLQCYNMDCPALLYNKLQCRSMDCMYRLQCSTVNCAKLSYNAVQHSWH